MDALPPFHRTALLLDLDGTLIDIAPAPDLVVVPPGLVDSLRRLRDRLGGALAVVTGRPIAQVDTLLGDAPQAVAGEHGGMVRHAPGAPIERPGLPAPPDAWRTTAARIAAAHPGVLLEPKSRGFVLHYRAAPAHGPAIRAALTAMIAETPADAAEFVLMPAHMALEVRPLGADKGRAVQALMVRAAFAGRLPVFIGDDVTDEDGMRAARALGGAGLRVDAAFGDPAGLRSWLDAAGRHGAWPATRP